MSAVGETWRQRFSNFCTKACAHLLRPLEYPKYSAVDQRYFRYQALLGFIIACRPERFGNQSVGVLMILLMAATSYGIFLVLREIQEWPAFLYLSALFAAFMVAFILSTVCAVYIRNYLRRRYLRKLWAAHTAGLTDQESAVLKELCLQEKLDLVKHLPDKEMRAIAEALAQRGLVYYFEKQGEYVFDKDNYTLTLKVTAKSPIYQRMAKQMWVHDHFWLQKNKWEH